MSIIPKGRVTEGGPLISTYLKGRDGSLVEVLQHLNVTNLHFYDNTQLSSLKIADTFVASSLH